MVSCFVFGSLWNREYRFEDAHPVSIRLSPLLINDIAITGVSGEVLTNGLVGMISESF